MANDIDTLSAPHFFARTAEGKNFFLSDELKKNQPIILSFFATWCAPCRMEIPFIYKLSKKYTDAQYYLVNVSGLEMSGRVMKEDLKNVQKMINTLEVDFPILLDKYGTAAQLYDALVLPRLVIIDRQGKIHYSHTGYSEELNLEIETAIIEVTTK